LDVRHARVLFTALSFRNPFDSSSVIHFSLNKFCQRYAKSNGGRYARAIRQLFADLSDTYIRVTEKETGEVQQYRFIDEVFHFNRAPRRRDARLVSSPQQELWIDGCRLSNEFLQVLGRIKELHHIKWKVLNAIRSPLAQAIYLYIPSRAHHHSADKPFEITLTKLLRQVSFRRVPRFKSLREQLFTLHKNEGRSILQQLDGQETLHGHFRVSLSESSDGSDFKLLAWVDKDLAKPKSGTRSSKLEVAYRQSGKPLEWLEDAFANIPSLSDYEVDLLIKAGVDVEKDRRFFEKAKALLMESKFVSLLAEAKGDALEDRPARKHPTARLIDRIMRTVREPVVQPTFATRANRLTMNRI
jgi:hypothetical protein